MGTTLDMEILYGSAPFYSILAFLFYLHLD